MSFKECACDDDVTRVKRVKNDGDPSLQPAQPELGAEDVSRSAYVTMAPRATEFTDTAPAHLAGKVTGEHPVTSLCNL